MFDAEDRLILFNQRYCDMYRLNPNAMQLGSNFSEQFRLRKEAGTFAPDLDKYLARVMDDSGRFRGNPRAGSFLTEGHETKPVRLPDGRCISITNQRIPGGGWVSTLAVITEHRNAERERDRTRAFLDTIALRGMVPPSTFVPLAEESGLIIPIGEWVLREACLEAAGWPAPLQVAVNLSPAQFQHGDLVALVHSVLLETGLNPNRLEL